MLLEPEVITKPPMNIYILYWGKYAVKGMVTTQAEAEKWRKSHALRSYVKYRRV